mgnify:CR=1 FL=1
MTRKALNRVYNRWCKARIGSLLPGILAELDEYAKGSETTGTQWITLYWAVQGILKYRPRHILECGTGSSTIVLGAAVARLMAQDSTYHSKVISMESVREWFDVASASLPEKYKSIVEIHYGPRELYQVGFVRGFIHGNVPIHNYDFLFLDGPNFTDERGVAFCADVFNAMTLSNAEVINGVVDGRASSAFVIQTFFGMRALRYWPVFAASTFSIPKTDLTTNYTSSEFKSSLRGKIYLMKFRR